MLFCGRHYNDSNNNLNKNQQQNWNKQLMTSLPVLVSRESNSMEQTLRTLFSPTKALNSGQSFWMTWSVHQYSEAPQNETWCQTPLEGSRQEKAKGTSNEIPKYEKIQHRLTQRFHTKIPIQWVMVRTQ